MVVRARATPLFVLPHTDVRVVDEATECASLSPNFVKCLLGEPRRLLGVMLPATSHPMLEPFVSCRSIDDAGELWGDLRRSLAMTPDERDFLDLWREHRAEAATLPTSDRWVQRLCLRYAGQSPKRLITLARLAQTLSADNEGGGHNSLGAFADASHYSRVCREYTGQPPTRWRHLSQTFS
jgi:hypothetical protein